MTDNPLTINNGAELENFGFSNAQPVIIDSHNDQISIVQFWRILQTRRLFSLSQREDRKSALDKTIT
jgi:hypothetical protein